MSALSSRVIGIIQFNNVIFCPPPRRRVDGSIPEGRPRVLQLPGGFGQRVTAIRLSLLTGLSILPQQFLTLRGAIGFTGR